MRNLLRSQKSLFTKLHHPKFRNSSSHFLLNTRWENFIAASVVLASMIFGVNLQTLPANAAMCDDVRFIFARGSGESLTDRSYRSWKNNITALIEDTNLRFSFYELGSRSYGGYQYPAVSVSDGPSGITNLLGAAISAGEAFEFGRSVEQGKNELKAYLNYVSSACPHTKFILGGYSQGAMIVSGVLNQLDSNKIIYVSTFGDPKLYLPEGKTKSGGRNKPQPDACRGINLSNYRLYVPDCYAYEGALGSYRPYQPAAYVDKLGAWCNKRDIMCSSGMSVTDHTSYISEELYGDAAEHIRQKISEAFPYATTNTKRNNHDLVFLFDTTGSMSSSIAKYQDEAKKLAANVYANDGHVALFEFRDLKEEFPTRELCSFSCSEEELYQAIDQLKTSGGGDEKESLLSAVMTVMNTTSWHNGAAKSVVALTDAGYHNPDYDGTTYVAVTDRSLEIDPVNIYVITTSSQVHKYSDLTVDTGGRVFSLNDDISLSSNQIFSRPVAKLSLPEYSGYIGETFVFDASASYSLNNEALTYDWDLDGDGKFEITNAGASISRMYTNNFDKYIQVRVNDNHSSSTMSAKVTVTAPVQTQLSEIITLDVSITSEGVAKVNFTTNADQVLVSINDAVLGTTLVTNGAGEISIEDIDEDARIVLTPYRSGERGIARSVTVTKGGEITIEEGLPNDDITHRAPSFIFSSATNTTTIPKAPDTGVYDKRLSRRQCNHG